MVCVPLVAPHQLGFNGFEERPNHRIVITISFTAYRDIDAVLGQVLLILICAILRPSDALLSVKLPITGDYRMTIRMMNAVLRRLSQSDRHVQGPDRQPLVDCCTSTYCQRIPLHAITDRPAGWARC